MNRTNGNNASKKGLEILKPALAAGLISLSFIALEILWTRIFSAEYFYTFAFLVLSLAILGMGLGGLVIRLWPRLSNENNLWIYLLLGSLISVVAPITVLHFNIDFTLLFSSKAMIGKIALVVFLLSASFLFGGMSLSLIFKKHHSQMPKIYMADLIGAGLGVIVAVLLMNLIQVPKTAFLVSIPSLIVAFIYAKKWTKVFPLALAIMLIAFLPRAEKLLSKQREERFELIYQHWDAMAQLKVEKVNDDFYYAIIDNAAHSPTYHFDGNFDVPDSMKLFPGYPMKYFVRRIPNCTFLALGAGSGGDVLNALSSGAKEIHAVEVVPQINKLMTHGFLYDFTGKIYSNPRVNVITEDGRSYVRRFKNKFDIIYALSSNTFASLASGAFALAENYLFTKEAFENYYDAMTDNGILFLDHQFYVPRLVSAAKEALEEKHVANPNDHIAVFHSYVGRRKLMVFSKKPIEQEWLANGLAEFTQGEKPYMVQQYPSPPDSLKHNLIAEIMKHGWQNVQDTVAIDISPNTDNRPFAAQMGLLKNLDFSKLDKIPPYEFQGFPLAKLLIFIILAIVTLIAIPINLIPFIKKGEKLTLRGWGYFFLIGAAFMAIEVILIQQFTLFIGSGVYAFVSILFILLLSSGVGSRFSQKVKPQIAFLGIIAWILLNIFVFQRLVSSLAFLEVPWRILITIILIAPLGFFMGMPFPNGTKKVGELVDWGFAVNGAASVLGSTAIMLVAFTLGYNFALLVGAAGYLLAMLVMQSKKGWVK